MKSCLIAYLLCAAGVSARIQAGRVARLAAKARLGGDISQLMQALNSGLVLDAQPSLSVAALARQRLGMEAAELEQESLPDAMMLRAFVGSAPDSVLVMPPDMLAEPVMPRGLMVVEPVMSASPLAVLPMEQQMDAPTLAVLPMGREPTVAASLDSEPSVKDAVKRLTSEMRAVEKNMGHKGLEDIISEFFAEAASKRAKEESAVAKVEKESGVMVADDESVVKKAAEETEAWKAEKESEAKTAEEESVATRAEKESVVKKANEESAAKKAEKESRGTTVEKESMAARVEKESAAKKAKGESAVNKAKKVSEGTKESVTTRKESSVKKIEPESAAMGAEKMQTARRAEKESVARNRKEAAVNGVGQKPQSSLLKKFAGQSHRADRHVLRGHRHVRYESPAHKPPKVHQPAKHEAPPREAPKVHQGAQYEASAHEVTNAHQDVKHEASAREAPKEVTPAEKASLPANAAKTIEQPLKDKVNFHGVAKAVAPAEQAARGFPTTEIKELHGMFEKFAMRHGRAWPKGNRDATWHDANTLYRRTCSNGHCVTKMLRSRK